MVIESLREPSCFRRRNTEHSTHDGGEKIGSFSVFGELKAAYLSRRQLREAGVLCSDRDPLDLEIVFVRSDVYHGVFVSALRRETKRRRLQENIHRKRKSSEIACQRANFPVCLAQLVLRCSWLTSRP